MNIFSGLSLFVLGAIAVQYLVLGFYHLFSVLGMTLGMLARLFPLPVVFFISPGTLFGPLAPTAPLLLAPSHYTIFDTIKMSWDFNINFSIYSLIITLFLFAFGLTGLFGLYEIYRGRMRGYRVWMALLFVFVAMVAWNLCWWGISHEKAVGFGSSVITDVIKIALYSGCFLFLFFKYKTA